jgi:glycosyltransferase involved in cell wall biosynthesis
MKNNSKEENRNTLASIKHSSEQPIITIITVVYNMGEFLEQTIISVIRLKSPSVKYIIIDGGSTDSTKDIIEKHVDSIDYWVSEPDKGIFDAMNKGWQAADNKSFILFLGAGDTILSLPDLHSVRSDDVIFGKVLFDNKIVFNATADFRLKLGSTVHHQALLIRKNLHHEPPFAIEFRTYADFDFNQRLLKNKIKFKYSSDLLAYARPHGNSGKFQMFESLQIVKKNFGLFYSILALIYYSGQKIKSMF